MVKLPPKQIRVHPNYFMLAGIMRQGLNLPARKLSDRDITNMISQTIIDEKMYNIMIRRYRRGGFQ